MIWLLLVSCMSCKLPEVPLPEEDFSVSCQEVSCELAQKVTVQDSSVVCYYSCVESNKQEGHMVDLQLFFSIDDDDGCYYLSGEYELNETCEEW